MNANQRQVFTRLQKEAEALGHTFEYRWTPAMVSGRCSCGFSLAEHRSQNALARNSKLDRKEREHLLEVVNKSKGVQS